jgi:hypothetical protein
MAKKKKQAPSLDKLNLREERVYFVGYGDLERFATHHLGLKNYSFVAVEEGANDSQYRFVVDLSDLTKYDLQDMDEIEQAKEVPSYRNSLLLHLLARKQLIPQGTYVVEVCW